jgi:hypothetical protein
MGELLDRKLQNEILTTAASEYPGQLRYGGGKRFASVAEVVNAAYLDEHGLLKVTWPNEFERHTLRSVTITAKGLDFLANDGGLSAILGVVTIKLHEDSIKALLLEKLAESNAPKSVRQRVAEQIRSLPAEATKEVALAVVKSGLREIPDLVAWIGAYIAAE